MDEFRKVTVIFNPNAGAGRFGMDEVEIEKCLERTSRSMGVDVRIEMMITESRGDGTKLAREAVSNGADVVAVAGGDGTVLEAVNSLHGTGSALGIIPIGSGNDTIVSITGQGDIEKCMQDIIKALPTPLDLGLMNGIYFLNVVGLGLDAEINHMVARKRERVRRFGPTFVYSESALKVLLRFKPYEISLSVDGSDFTDRTISLCTVGNGTTCGGGYRLTPKALMDDGKLDLSVSGYIGKPRSIMNIRTAYKGEHIRRKENDYCRFDSLVLKGKDRKLPYHIDGEAGFAREVKIDIVPSGLLCVHQHSRDHLA